MRMFNHTEASKWGLFSSFNFVDYLIVNGTAAALSNVNAGGDDVPANGSADGVALDATELAAVIALGGGVAVLKTATTYTQRRAVARSMKYRKAVAL